MTPIEIIISSLRFGEENAISRRTLVEQVGLPMRDVDRLIEHLRRDQGVVICSGNSGYFYPKAREELERYVRRETARVNSIRKNLKSARVSLAKWDGESHGE